MKVMMSHIEGTTVHFESTNTLKHVYILIPS